MSWSLANLGDAFLGLESTLSVLTIGHWPVIAHLLGLVGSFHLRWDIERY